MRLGWLLVKLHQLGDVVHILLYSFRSRREVLLLTPSSSSEAYYALCRGHWHSGLAPRSIDCIGKRLLGVTRCMVKCPINKTAFECSLNAAFSLVWFFLQLAAFPQVVSSLSVPCQASSCGHVLSHSRIAAWSQFHTQIRTCSAPA